ncbi:CAAX protease self-immunity [Geodermatophilus obscurus]|uniref:CAAX protease self-immunity n=2 Tax=Geodermatophilus obscurus TaxID=1861 RepID=A0A1I5FRG5_9ACTN|nr:CAAX protease self-immunity [Geodermatophilus obscurus]
MFPRMSALGSAATFYALAVVMVTVVAATGGSTTVAMITPVVAAVLMLLVVTRDGWTRSGWASLGLHRLGLRLWPVAVLVPLAVISLGGAVAAALGIAEWNPVGQPGEFGPASWPVIVATNILYAALTVSLTEEIGWRGYLLPRLVALGERRAMLLSGLMHGIWHLPVVLLTSLYLPAGNRAVVIPMFLLCVAAGGVLMGWLRLRTDSVWPAVLAHSAHNVAIFWLADLLDGQETSMAYIAGEAGVVPVATYVALAAVLLVRTRPAKGSSGYPVAVPPARAPEASAL